MAHRNKPHTAPLLDGKKLKQFVADGSIVSGVEVIGDWEWNGKKWIDVTPEPKLDFYQRDMGPAIQSGDGGNLSFIDNTARNSITLADGRNLLDLGNDVVIGGYGGIDFTPGEGTRFNNPILKRDIHLSLSVKTIRGDLFINGELTPQRIFGYFDRQLSDGLTFEVKQGDSISKEKYYLVQEGDRNICLYQTIRSWDREDGIDSSGQNKIKTFTKDSIHTISFTDIILSQPIDDDPIDDDPRPIDPKPPEVPITLDTPSIEVSPSTYTYNINSPQGFSIIWKTQLADKVNFNLGKVQKELKPQGELVLTKSDFPNGVGQYTIYLQPVNNDGGSGAYESIVVNVISKAYIPGPDIVTINYPENIIGADFKGYDVDFRIDWSSINTNWINIYAGKVSENTLVAKKQTPQGKAILNIQNVLQAAGRNIEKDADVIDFKLCLVPYNSEADEIVSGKKEEIKIRFDVSNLKLRRNNVIKDVRNAITKTLDKSILKADNSKYLTHILHFGDGENKLISTWDIDRETFSEYEVVNELTGEERKVKEEESLVLKLYEPLGGEIQPNQQVWISKIQSIPIVESLTILNEGDEDCIVLQPNLNDEFTDNVGLQIYDDLITSGSTTSTDIVNEFVSGSGYNLKALDIDFVSQSYSIIETGSGAFKQKGAQTINYGNFVKYSSAEERIENFWYKVKLIEFYNNKLDLVTSGSHYTGSITLRNEKQKIEHQINGVKNGFDAFESFLYTSSSLGGLTYPGAGQNAVSSSTSADGLSWYNSTLGDRFSPSEGTARHYDLYNDSRLVNNLPSHVQNSSEGAEFTLFFDMIGQHFDNIWVYIKCLSESRKLENKQNVGIKDRFLYQMLESLGWDADIGVKSAALWDFAFGKDKDGTQSRATSGKKRQNEVWRRILNNLPYLLKHKGTKRAIHALMSCYGVPTSILTIAEFGGPRDVTQSGTSKFSYEDRTAAINISGSTSIDIPWKSYNGDHPNSVEIRINTEVKQDHKIISGSNWSLDVIKDTGSLAKVQLTVGSVSASTATFPFFNDEYTQIVVNRTTGSLTDEFTFYAKEGFQERIRNEVSKSLTSVDKSWESGSQISIGGSTFNGKVDEFRLWTTALNESVIDNHTLLPDAIDGNSPSASSEDLIFRNDFEYPKNRYSDTSINNVAITTTYAASSTATNFDDNTTYPYQYTAYDRTVTANVPSSGTSFGNKFRFENQFELGDDTVLNATSSIDLSHRQRSTKKSFDKAPVDTNKLGLFFSPTKEIDLDILKSVGPLNIDDYIGDPADNYNEEYSALKTYREYYFQRYNLNFNEYVQLVRYFDKSLFDQLVTLVPARAKVASGLLLQPHILERSKTKWNRPSGEENYHEATISNTVNNQLSSSISNIDALISASEDVNPIVEYNNIEGHVSESDDSKVTVEIRNYDGTYQSQDDQSLSGTITRNQSSTMGGFEFSVNAQITGSVIGSYFQNVAYEQIGMDPDGLARLGFGLYGKDSYSVRTRFDGRGNLVKDKVRVFKIKESYQEEVVTNVNTNDSSMGTQVSEITKYKDKVVILSQSGSAPTVSGNVTEVTPLDGFFSTHYVNVGDLTSGMENSFFNGSKQTSATTLDGGSPVQTFTTNPNTLRVSDSGRGSGEPILEVD